MGCGGGPWVLALLSTEALIFYCKEKIAMEEGRDRRRLKLSSLTDMDGYTPHPPAQDSATEGYSSAAKGGLAGVLVMLLTIVVYVFFKRRKCSVRYMSNPGRFGALSVGPVPTPAPLRVDEGGFSHRYPVFLPSVAFAFVFARLPSLVELLEAWSWTVAWIVSLFGGYVGKFNGYVGAGRAMAELRWAVGFMDGYTLHPPAQDSATGGYSSAAKGGVAGVLITLLMNALFLPYEPCFEL
ncbi:hypothetical protein POTOM_042775 [Populus tomentosa]|uniref:Uncharacterized protein n=1 Tax=Populus tomentosa TaxID=118781 RepID=A0A8X8CGR1_POPTO|nr:hypothetical protein POTOM_042775 [Populus tomentosa]